MTRCPAHGNRIQQTPSRAVNLFGATPQPDCRRTLVFLTPTSHSNIYDHLVGRVWHRSLQRCGLKPRRLYAQRHTFLSHALAMGNSPADLAAAAGHSTKMLLDTYAKPTGRLKMPNWQTA